MLEPSHGFGSVALTPQLATHPLLATATRAEKQDLHGDANTSRSGAWEQMKKYSTANIGLMKGIFIFMCI